MVEESRGLPKKPENARWLFSYARGLRHRLGRIYINFGSPVPLYERIVALRADGLTDRQVVERIALDICHRLNQATPVTATAAVCVAMLGEDRALTLDEVCATVAPLARYLDARGWPVAGGADLTDRATVSQTLHDLVGSGVLTCYSEGPTTVWGIGDDQHLIVAVYRNSAIHVLVMRAIAELALLAIVQTPGATKRTGWEKALAVRELLKFDFFFAGRDEFADELWREFAIMTGRSHDRSAPLDTGEAERSLNESDLLVAHLVLRPFVDAYRVVAEELVNLGPGRERRRTRSAHEVFAPGPAMVAAAPHHRGVGVGGDVQHRSEDGAPPRSARRQSNPQTKLHTAGQPSSPNSTSCRGRSVSWRGCDGTPRRCEICITAIRMFATVHAFGNMVRPKLASAMTVAFNEERQLMTEFTDISYEVDNGLAWITINRPERYNAFRARTLDELIRAFKLAWGSSEVGVICLTGAGEKAFCTGGDQKQRAETGDYGPSETGLFEVDTLHRVIRDVPKPVIAAVNGFAIGGGHVLHVLCDLTIAADTAVFGQNGPRVGSFDAGFGTGYLARIVGEKRAREIWFLCRRYSARAGSRVGPGQQGRAGR